MKQPMMDKKLKKLEKAVAEKEAAWVKADDSRVAAEAALANAYNAWDRAHIALRDYKLICTL